MQAITTRYHSAGNVKGSRIKATAQAGSITLHYDDSLNASENHKAAAQALAKKFGWQGTYYGGTCHGGESVWVYADDRDSFNC